MDQKSNGRWAEIEPILDRALELDEAERPDFLSTACGADNKLRRAVEALLVADQAADGLFTASGSSGESIQQQPALSILGTQVGPYRILKHIGEGGMARVFLAERVDGEFEQHVAIKFLSLSIDPKAQQRFQAECQNLARLDHPNIVHLLDGGIADNGANYLVMSHVAGEPIDQYADNQQLDLNQRLRLFAQLIQAVQYAHRNLIVHRDLKPSNVLVTTQGQVKLLDFGISFDLSADSTATNSVMTPRYATPEQILGQSITTATDVYGLGCVLHELLVGEVPFASQGASIDSLVARTRQLQPPRPSSLAAQSPIDLHRLRGDLDAVLMKCLQTDPSQRYESAAALLDDVKAYLAGYPVSAREASGMARFGRLLKRHWLAAATVASLLLIAVGATAFHIQSVTRERNYADATAQFLTGLMLDVKPTERNEANVQVLPITRFYELGLERIADSPMPLQKKLELVKQFVSGFNAAGDWAGAVKAGEIATDFVAAESPGSYDHLSAIFSRAQAYTNNHQFDLARADYERLVAAIGGKLDPVSQATALTWNDLAVLERRAGNYQKAESHIRSAIEVAEKIPEKGGVYNYTALLNNHYQILHNLSRLEQAQQVLGRAIAIRDEHYDAGHYRRAALHSRQGKLLDAQGRHDEAKLWHDKALEVARRNLGEKHPVSLTIRALAANNLLLRRQYQAARAELLDIVEQAEASGGPYFEEPDFYLYLARAHYLSGDFPAAASAARSSLAYYDQHYAGNHPRMTPALMIAAAVAARQSQLQQSQDLAARALEKSLSLPPDHPSRIASNQLMSAFESNCTLSSEALVGYVLNSHDRARTEPVECG